MQVPPIQRLLSLIRRELRAIESGLSLTGEDVPTGKDVVTLGLARGQTLWAKLAGAPRNKDALRARMDVIAQSFAHLLELEATRARSRRKSPMANLRVALRALARASGARDALVLDTRSPMVWGSASGMSGEVLGRARLRLVGSDEQGTGTGAERAQQRRKALSLRAIAEVRSLSEIRRLPRGAELRRSVRDAEIGYLVRSFASIYLLLVVYPGPFDELRAEREAARALQVIEPLVLSLPPPEPTDGSSQSAVRRQRRP
ncbi:MAG: hypothetical protein HY898_17240 [Deltaproteobacteria bacterium]|nr:hypothetical protein [Deltaproteobacteria bacterium]